MESKIDKEVRRHHYVAILKCSPTEIVFGHRHICDLPISAIIYLFTAGNVTLLGVPTGVNIVFDWITYYHILACLEIYHYVTENKVVY